MRKILSTLVVFVVVLLPCGGIIYERSQELKHLRSKIEHLKAENAKLQSVLHDGNKAVSELQKRITLSRYYTFLARARGCTHEPSVVLVETVLKVLKNEQINRCHFEPDDIMALLLVESCFNPRAKSHAGALGLGQVMPRTANEYGIDDKARLYEPELNIELSVKILNDYAAQYDCNKRLGLLAYNRGPTKVAQVLRQGQDPSNRYDDKVIRFGGL